MALLRRVSAWTALISFSVTIGLGWMVVGHGGPDDDAACRPEVTATGHSHSAQFEKAPEKASSPATHCPFCHWQRAVGGASVSALQSASVMLEPVEWMLAAGPRVPRSTALDAQLSRGPPSRA